MPKADPGDLVSPVNQVWGAPRDPGDLVSPVKQDCRERAPNPFLAFS
jgi:hypothetical protein